MPRPKEGTLTFGAFVFLSQSANKHAELREELLVQLHSLAETALLACLEVASIHGHGF